MRLKRLLLFFNILLITGAYAQTADIVEGCAPLQVNFTPPAGPSSYFWDFKDGATSTLSNPSNTYISSGTYVVEFKETPGGPIVGTVTITVYDQPDPSIVASSGTSGCVPFNFTVEDNTTLPAGVNATNFTWSFGDGGTGTGSPASYTYNAEGSYDITIQLVTNLASCNATKIFPGFVSCTEAPDAAYTTLPDPPLACFPPLTVGFTNTTTSGGSAITYSWDFGNGNSSTNQSPLPQSYTTNGDFPVTLTATDTNGCINTYTANVTIGQPTSNFEMPDTVCLNTDFTINNTSSAGNYSWGFGANATPPTSTDVHPTVQFSTTGLHSITLSTTDVSGGCTHDTTLQVFVEEAQVSFVSNPTYACYEPATFNFTGSSPNDVVSWDWTFDDDSTATGQTTSYDYAESDTSYAEDGETIYETTLTITTAAGCTATYSDVDTIHLPWARFMPDIVEGCAPLTVTFSDSSRSNTPEEPIVDWTYDYGDGNTATFNNEDPHTYVFTIPGEYDVVLMIENASGCRDTSDTVRIQVGDLSALDFSATPTSVCVGDTVFFTNLTGATADIDAWHYSTEDNRMFHCYQDDNPYHVFNNETGFHDVTLTAEYNGCYSSVTKSNYIEVKGPIARFNYQQDCDLPMDVLFTDESQDATSISWDFGDGNNSVSTIVPYTYASTGDYEVILTASNGTSGCPDDKDTAIVHIRTIEAQFTPEPKLCGNQYYTFDASNSVDVQERCYRGYTWFFSEPSMRPITTDLPTEDINLSVTGPQTVGLVVEDINGCVDSIIFPVTVYNLYAGYTVDDDVICYPATVAFTDTSTSDTAIVDWSWSFGDGNTAATQNSSNTYNSGPVSPIPTSLTITDELGCTETQTLDLQVYAPVSFVSSLPNPANSCVGDEISFFATDYTSQGSNLSYSWDFNDGNTSTDQSPKNTYNTAGSYTVTMTYTEISSGCEGSITRPVNIQDYPVAALSAIDDTLCATPAALFTFNDNSTSTSPITGYQWSFGNGQSSVLPGPTTASYLEGTYDVKLVVSTGYGCLDSATITIAALSLDGNFTLSPNSICKGDEITFELTNDTSGVWQYSWDFGDGTQANNVSPVTHQYNFNPPSGQTVAKLTLYALDSVCELSIPQDVFIHEVIAGFNISDDTICYGETVNIFDMSTSNADSFDWTLGDGTTSTNQNIISHSYPGAGSYQVTLQITDDATGCQDDTTATILVYSLPVVTAVGDTICPNSTAQLNVTDFNATYGYSWGPSNMVSNTSIHNPSTLTDDDQTYYVVTVVSPEGCIAKDSTLIYVLPEIIGVDFDTIVIIGDSIALPIDNMNGFLTFSWNPEDGLSCIDCPNPGVGPLLEDTEYSVLVTDPPYNCSNAIYNFYIEVVPETRIEMPTTFTPNGDGVNDYAFIGYWGVKELFEYSIYNRWGEQIFNTTNIDVGWDGRFNGVLQNNDIYVWKIRALTWLDEEIVREGHLHLMR